MALTVEQINQQYAALESQVNYLRNNNVSVMGTAGGNAITALQSQMQNLVAQRDQIARDNDAWHKANKTGPYATGSGSVTAAAAEDAKAIAEREDASAFLKNLLTTYGLGELVGQADQLIRDWGTASNVISYRLKETEPYKQRFKGLLDLQAKGVTDIKNEAEYIAQESAYRKAFRDSGLGNYLGAAGSRDEIAAIGRLVGEYSVSVDEVRARINDAARVVNDTNAEVKNALQRYYNIAPSDLVAYTLDPTQQKTRINDLANAAVVGGYGATNGLSIDQAAAEKYANLYSGQDLQQTALAPAIQQARAVRDSTSRLASIEGGSLSDSEALLASNNLDQDAREKVSGLQSRERARFGGSSGVSSKSLKRPNVF